MTPSTPLPRITEVRVAEPYTVELTFTDGTQGKIDLRSWVFDKGPIFKPLEDPAYFAQVRLSQTGGTIEWPNGVDFCPDVLYQQITGRPIGFRSDPQLATPRV
ncbi:MAG TPA: DUF2442 domain-containing protein [Humisphaera sp.]|jgi:hypothetical protein|nr:DUF2442 domain-containing protein [Humisphaera sp.]